MEEEYLATFFYPEENRFYVITDSVDTELNQGRHKIRLYFVTPIVDDLQLQCPDEFGIIVMNSKNRIIYENNLTGSTGCNFYLSYNKMIVQDKERPLLCLGNSGCGSGASLIYFDIKLNDERFEMNQAFSAQGGGFGFTKILPNKNLYIEFERINPEAHYAGNTRYKIICYNLSTHGNISVKESKYLYEHFVEICQDVLFEKIKKKEPNLLCF